MPNTDKCKGCRESVRVPDKQIQHMVSEIESSGKFQLVENETYQYRLSKCEDCKYLQYGSTCIQCGCIVQIRARLAAGTCPFPGEARW
jgi:hypothetical protein